MDASGCIRNHFCESQNQSNRQKALYRRGWAKCFRERVVLCNFPCTKPEYFVAHNAGIAVKSSWQSASPSLKGPAKEINESKKRVHHRHHLFALT